VYPSGVPLYEFKCPTHGTVSTTMEYGVVPDCELCKSSMKRVYSFYVERSFVPHFNMSVGRFVNNQTEFNDALKVAGEEATLRTDILHNYVAMEAGDAAAFGQSDDDLASTADAQGHNPRPYEPIT
jgi:hypothetical protein